VKISELKFDSRGLLPAIVQSQEDGKVLMLAYVSKESLELTLTKGQMHFFSRSRSELWLKGATSGNIQTVVELRADCDGDSILALVSEAGPACHTGERSCFDNHTPLELG
jgi:phosphoribosyl-AMP cyclohydrolase